MDRIIEVKVGGNYLSKDNKNAGVKGEANVTYLRITFDEGWDDYAKTVTFWDAQGNNPVKRIQGIDLIEDITKDIRTYITPIPAEPLAIAGELTFVIDGYLDGKRQRSISDKLVVKDAPITDDAGEPTDPTPTQAEQLQVQIDKIMGDIQQATIAKEEAQQSVEEAEQQAQKAKQSAEDAQSYSEQAQVHKANAAEQAETAKTYAEDANLAAVKAETAITHNPIIVEGFWYIWDAHSEEYINTTIKAQAGSTVYTGDNPPPEADVWVDPEGEGDITDQTYTPESENAQSGKAVAEALKTIKVPTKVSELTNDEGYLTEHQDISGKADTSYVDDEISYVYWDMSYKADKTDIYYEYDSYPVYEFGTSHNVEMRYEEVSSISFVFDDGEYYDDYTSGLSFDSGSTPTAIDYTDSGILNWVGTDCTTNDGLSIFQPSENTHYDIVFYFNGWQFVGLVNGYVPAAGNGAV